jgi:four helix bundle protein
MAIKDFRDLNIWKRGIKLVQKIYESTNAFPKEEIYVLTSQLRRAAISIPSNIAEGFARFHNNEYRQFLFIALGSGAEAITQLTIAVNLNYLTKEHANVVSDEIDQISKMIMSLIKKLNRKD